MQFYTCNGRLIIDRVVQGIGLAWIKIMDLEPDRILIICRCRIEIRLRNIGVIEKRSRILQDGNTGESVGRSPDPQRLMISTNGEISVYDVE